MNRGLKYIAFLSMLLWGGIIVFYIESSLSSSVLTTQEQENIIGGSCNGLCQSLGYRCSTQPCNPAAGPCITCKEDAGELGCRGTDASDCVDGIEEHGCGKLIEDGTCIDVPWPDIDYCSGNQGHETDYWCDRHYCQ